MRASRCPFFNCTNVTKHGMQNGLQRYRCTACGRTWASKSRPSRKLNKLWRQYAFDGRTAKVLARDYKVSAGCIRSQLAGYIPSRIVQKPRTVAVIRLLSPLHLTIPSS
jgi:hypothetical protein